MLHAGMTISVHYDSLIAKLMTWGEDREQCRRRMLSALREFHIVGIATSIPFHIAMLDNPAFIDGAIDTDFVEEAFNMDTGLRPETTELAAIAAAAFIRMNGERPVPVVVQNAQNRAWGMYARGRRSSLEQGWRRNYL
jgi:acetyl-CoA carboxylase biotin carboxylase subunit